MALGDVELEINKSAKDVIAVIKEETDAEIASIIADTDSKIASMKEKEEKKLKDVMERLRRQELSSIELENKRIVLSKKNEVLTKVFSEILTSFESLPANEKLEHYKKMVLISKKVIDNPKAYLAEVDKFSAEDLGVSSVVNDSRITSGIVFESEDGTIQLDMQYRTIFQVLWDREIKNLSDILFG